MKRAIEYLLIFMLVVFAIIPNAVSCEQGLVPSPAQQAAAQPTPAATTAAATTPATATSEPTSPATTTQVPATTTEPTTEPTAPSPTTATPEPTPAEPAVMTELGVELVSITPNIRADEIIEVTVRTVPGATIFLQPVNPVTGTRSAWPKEADGGKIRVADEAGLATWSWQVYKMMISGEGTLEFLVTTSTDPDYISQWVPTMTRSTMDGFAARDDTALVEIPWTVR